MSRKERYEKIRSAMHKIVNQNVSGRATLKELSKETGITVNGLSQSLGAMKEFRLKKGKGKDQEWEFVRGQLASDG